MWTRRRESETARDSEEGRKGGKPARERGHSRLRVRFSATGRNNELGPEEWRALGAAARLCPALVELWDFEWARALLAGDAGKLDLSKKKLGHAEAAVLGALLPRCAPALRDLNVRCG